MTTLVPVPTPANTPSLALAQASLDALRALAETPEFRAVRVALDAARIATEAAEVWDTPLARRAEQARGHLMLALEAAGVAL